MKNFIKNKSITKTNFVHIYSGISKVELDEKIDSLFLSSEYEMKQGELGAATYVRGNRVLRILFGAFVKYFKFDLVTTTNDSNEVIVEVKKKSSGISGGLLGVNQVRKELKRLAEILQTL